MIKTQVRYILPLLCALFGNAGLVGHAAAHANPYLEQALKGGDARNVADYQRTLLHTQLANHYQQLAQTDAASRHFAAADQAYAKIAPGYLKAHAAGHMANEYASAGDFAKARASLATIDDLALRTHTAWKVVSKLAKAGDKEAAAQMLLAIEDEVRGVDDAVLRAELLTGTGAGWKAVDPGRGAGMVFEAYGISRIVADPAAQATLLNELGANFIDIGRKDMAMRVFAEAERIGLGLTDPLQRAQVFAMHGGELAEKGERQRAVPALDMALSAALQVSDAHERAEVLSEIARNYGQSWTFAPGLKVADNIEDPYYQAEAYIRIGKNLWKTGQHDQARALFERTERRAILIADDVERATVLRKLASEWIVLKAPERAMGLLEQIARIVNGLTG